MMIVVTVMKGKALKADVYEHCYVDEAMSTFLSKRPVHQQISM